MTIIKYDNKKTALSLEYAPEYYSASQCFLYIGDVFIDEVVNMSYEVQQQKTPIYGYASQLFDAVAPGNVILRGMFSINFKESGYLYLILRRAKGVSGESPFRPTKKGKANINDPHSVVRLTIEDYLSSPQTRKDQFEFNQSIGKFVTTGQGGKFDEKFEALAEVFEDQIWAGNSLQPTGSADGKITHMRTDDNAFDNFNIYVVYGDFNDPTANHTIRLIEGVHLIGQAQEVRVSGEPVYETYSFIARNLK